MTVVMIERGRRLLKGREGTLGQGEPQDEKVRIYLGIAQTELGHAFFWHFVARVLKHS